MELEAQFQYTSSMFCVVTRLLAVSNQERAKRAGSRKGTTIESKHVCFEHEKGKEEEKGRY